MNWYVYCANNPLRYTDPSGLTLNDVNGDKNAQQQNHPDINKNAPEGYLTRTYITNEGYKDNNIGNFGCLFTGTINVVNDINKKAGKPVFHQVAEAAKNDNFFNKVNGIEQLPIEDYVPIAPSSFSGFEVQEFESPGFEFVDSLLVDTGFKVPYIDVLTKVDTIINELADGDYKTTRIRGNDNSVEALRTLNKNPEYGAYAIGQFNSSHWINVSDGANPDGEYGVFDTFKFRDERSYFESKLTGLIIIEKKDQIQAREALDRQIRRDEIRAICEENGILE